MVVRLPHRWRWRIADWLGRRPGWCSASLGAWAHWGPERDGYTLRGSRVDPVCVSDAVRNGHCCYCGALDGHGCDVRTGTT